MWCIQYVFQRQHFSKKKADMSLQGIIGLKIAILFPGVASKRLLIILNAICYRAVGRKEYNGGSNCLCNSMECRDKMEEIVLRYEALHQGEF